MIGEIIVVKLVNDEYYMGTLVEEDEQGIRLENALRVILIYSRGATSYDIGILPWCDLSDETSMYLDKLHVLYYTIPRSDILSYYKKSVRPAKPAESGEEYSASTEVLQAVLEKISSNNSVH